MKDSSTDQPLEMDDVIRQARSEEPFGAHRDYGFATRLRESIKNSTPGTIEVFGTLCWRLSLVCLPVVVPAMIAIAFLNSQQMPEGLSSAFGIFSSLDTLSIF